MANSKQPAILITGVAGLIGSRFADWILKNHPEYEVVGIDSLFGGYRDNVPSGVYLYARDLAEQSIDIIFEQHNVKYVFHLAAYAAEGLSPFVRQFNYKNNVIATMNVINNCIRYSVERLVFTSSMSVYGHGKKDGSKFTEEDLPCPIDPYGIAKYACEMDIRVAGEQHNLDWCIIRPHNVYGRNQNIWDSYRNVIGIWMYNILHQSPMLIYGDGRQKRAFTYIDDILPCLFQAAVSKKASKQIINLGGIHSFTILHAAYLLKSVVEEDGYSASIEHREPRHEVKHAVPSWQKSIDLLGFEHKTPLLEGMAEMWKWAKSQPDRPKFRWKKYELDTGLYSYWK